MACSNKLSQTAFVSVVTFLIFVTFKKMLFVGSKTTTSLERTNKFQLGDSDRTFVNASGCLHCPSTRNGVITAGERDAYTVVRRRAVPDKNTSSPCGELTFRPCCWPLTALASFPGSGNTWTRHLMQQATGFYTGDIYNSSLNKRDGWAGEGHTDRNTLNVKTHLKPSAKGQPQFERAVLLLRDVGDAVMAEFNRLMAGPVGRVPNAMYETDVWTKSFLRLSQNWADFNVSWLKFKGNLYILRYEELKGNLKEELQRVSRFMDVQVSEERLNCVLVNREGNYHRPESTAASDVFSGEMRRRMRELTSHVEKEIEKAQL